MPAWGDVLMFDRTASAWTKPDMLSLSLLPSSMRSCVAWGWPTDSSEQTASDRQPSLSPPSILPMASL